MQSISLEEKSIQTLELPAVLERLSRQCVTATARESAEALRPAVSAVEIRKLLEETSAAKTMMVVREVRHSPVSRTCAPACPGRTWAELSIREN